MPKTQRHVKAESELRKMALAYPETREDFPWGHRALKVKGKAFLFMTLEEGTLSLSLKLPFSSTFALMQPFAEPTGYGLGKSGWVTASFDPKQEVPIGLLGSWIAESFRAVAPKKLAAALSAASAQPVSKRPGAGSAPSKSKSARKTRPAAPAKKAVKKPRVRS